NVEELEESWLGYLREGKRLPDAQIAQNTRPPQATPTSGSVVRLTAPPVSPFDATPVARGAMPTEQARPGVGTAPPGSVPQGSVPFPFPAPPPGFQTPQFQTPTPPGGWQPVQPMMQPIVQPVPRESSSITVVPVPLASESQSPIMLGAPVYDGPQ